MLSSSDFCYLRLYTRQKTIGLITQAGMYVHWFRCLTTIIPLPTYYPFITGVSFSGEGGGLFVFISLLSAEWRETKTQCPQIYTNQPPTTKHRLSAYVTLRFHASPPALQQWTGNRCTGHRLRHSDQGHIIRRDFHLITTRNRCTSSCNAVQRKMFDCV
jgi:hypothetical protein